jgi:hypothetical protein
MEEGIPHGGWVPKGRKTEAGPLPWKYQMQEMPTTDYPPMKGKNVLDSDGRLIISHGELTGDRKAPGSWPRGTISPGYILTLTNSPFPLLLS